MKVLDLEGLGTYDSEIKKLISSKDEKVKEHADQRSDDNEARIEVLENNQDEAITLAELDRICV